MASRMEGFEANYEHKTYKYVKMNAYKITGIFLSLFSISNHETENFDLLRNVYKIQNFEVIQRLHGIYVVEMRRTGGRVEF